MILLPRLSPETTIVNGGLLHPDDSITKFLPLWLRGGRLRTTLRCTIQFDTKSGHESVGCVSSPSSPFPGPSGTADPSQVRSGRQNPRPPMFTSDRSSPAETRDGSPLTGPVLRSSLLPDLRRRSRLWDLRFCLVSGTGDGAADTTGLYGRLRTLRGGKGSAGVGTGPECLVPGRTLASPGRSRLVRQPQEKREDKVQWEGPPREVKSFF